MHYQHRILALYFPRYVLVISFKRNQKQRKKKQKQKQKQNKTKQNKKQTNKQTNKTKQKTKTKQKQNKNKKIPQSGHSYTCFDRIVWNLNGVFHSWKAENVCVGGGYVYVCVVFVFIFVFCFCFVFCFVLFLVFLVFLMIQIVLVPFVQMLDRISSILAACENFIITKGNHVFFYLFKHRPLVKPKALLLWYSETIFAFLRQYASGCLHYFQNSVNCFEMQYFVWVAVPRKLTQSKHSTLTKFYGIQLK